MNGGELGGEKQSQASSMVVSWTWRILKAPTRVIIEGGGLQARANLNGDEDPVLRGERGQNNVTWV